jgi:uncharacterized membrane protein
MDNYVAIVFDSEAKASDALHALWNLDNEGEITVHGAAVIQRDDLGYVRVATKQTHPGLRTALGVGIGALLGALAGPIGAAAGASIAVGTAAGVGAAAGGAIGLTADAVKSSEHEEAAYESRFVLGPGQSAVVAEISEDWTTPVNTLAERLGGTVYRRPKGDVTNDSLFGPDYGYYLYPYDYDPYWD